MADVDLCLSIITQPSHARGDRGEGGGGAGSKGGTAAGGGARGEGGWWGRWGGVVLQVVCGGGAMGLHVMELFVAAPARYPDLHVLVLMIWYPKP
jgi:hypothetical protein